MDMMILGETFSGKTTAKTFVGFWMPAGGSAGVAAVEVFHNSTASAFSWVLETKSSDDPDSAAEELGSPVVVTSTGSTVTTYQAAVSGAKDQVRYKLKFLGTTAGSIHLQFAQPLWQPN